jgi:hypothetical protein
VNAEQGLARESPTEPIMQEAVEPADAQRNNGQMLHVLLAERMLEIRGLGLVGKPPGQQQAHVVRLEPTQRERQNARRGRIEPLEIVDRDEEGSLFGKHLQ